MPATNSTRHSYSRASPSPAWVTMGTPRDKHALAGLPDGRVLVLGGTPDDRELLSSTEIYDPATGEFTPGPSMDIRRYKLSTTLDSAGHVIVAGGGTLLVATLIAARPAE